MSTRLTYFGAAGYEIVGPTHRIVIDPFLSHNPHAPCSVDELETPDVILVSHAAPDHYGDTAALAKRTGAPVVCAAAVRFMPERHRRVADVEEHLGVLGALVSLAQLGEPEETTRLGWHLEGRDARWVAEAGLAIDGDRVLRPPEVTAGQGR